MALPGRMPRGIEMRFAQVRGSPRLLNVALYLEIYNPGIFEKSGARFSRNAATASLLAGEPIKVA